MATLPTWFKVVIAAIGVAVLGIVVIEPRCLCCVPFVGVFLAILISAMRSKGFGRIAAICFSLVAGIFAGFVTVNLWNLHAAAKPIRALGGDVYTSGDGMADINGPSAVTSVELRDTGASDSDLERLAPNLSNFPGLRILDLSGTQVTDKGLDSLGNLDGLYNLGLAGTFVTDEGLETLQRFRNLKGLNLKGTRVTDAGIAKLQRDYPNLIVVK